MDSWPDGVEAVPSWPDGSQASPQRQRRAKSQTGLALFCQHWSTSANSLQRAGSEDYLSHQHVDPSTRSWWRSLPCANADLGDTSPDTPASPEFEEGLGEQWDVFPRFRQRLSGLQASSIEALRPDLRGAIGRRAPQCAPDLSVPRAEKIDERWDAVPRVKQQLPASHLEAIRKATKEGAEGELSADEWLWQRRQACLMRGKPPRSAQKDVRARSTSYLRSLPMHEGGSGRHHGLFIPCQCCRRPRPKPWKQKDKLLFAEEKQSPSMAVQHPAGATVGRC